MVIFLRVIAFLCTCYGLATFVSLNSTITHLDEDRTELINELEKDNPNKERVADRKEWIQFLEKDFDSRSSIITGVVSIVLSFLISDLSKYLKNRNQARAAQKTPDSANQVSRVSDSYRKMSVELQSVSLEEKILLKRMLELYLYDLSGFESTDLNEQGEFGYSYLDHYWTESERHPLFVKADGKTVGFILLNRFGYSEKIDYSVAEFFILKKYRKSGAGRAAARAAFEKFHGFWEIRTHENNDVAKKFWRRTIEEYTNGEYSELPYGLKDWSGPIWTFETQDPQKNNGIKN